MNKEFLKMQKIAGLITEEDVAQFKLDSGDLDLPPQEFKLDIAQTHFTSAQMVKLREVIKLTTELKSAKVYGYPRKDTKTIDQNFDQILKFFEFLKKQFTPTDPKSY